MDRKEQPCGSNSLQISPPSVQLPGRGSLHVAPSLLRPQRRPSRLKRPAQTRPAPPPLACPAGSVARPQPCFYLGAVCPAENGSRGKAKRRWKPRNCALGSGAAGRARLPSGGGVQRLYTAPVVPRKPGASLGAWLEGDLGASKSQVRVVPAGGAVCSGQRRG